MRILLNPLETILANEEDDVVIIGWTTCRTDLLIQTKDGICIQLQ